MPDPKGQVCAGMVCSAQARELPSVNPVINVASRNRRQHPRTRVAWPVIVETMTHRYPCQIMDISTHGAKVMTSAPLQPGVVVRLQIIPPTGRPLRVGALVWRVDADGVAVFFGRGVHHPFIRAA